MLITLATVAAARPAIAAEAFPARPIRIVVPFGAGGVNDIVARALAERLKPHLGIAPIVENKPGAGSVLGANLVAHGPADAYTLLMGANTAFTVNPNLQKNLPYDVQRDFVPVSALFSVPIVLLARPDFAADRIDELVALAKRSPGSLSYASFGQGSSSHLVMEWLKTRAGIDIVHVPYNGGPAATQALLAGQVPLAFDALTGALPQLRAGKVKAIALMQGRPSAAAPELPTMAGSRHADIELVAWAGLFAPAATPADRLDRLRRAIAEALRSPDFVTRLAEFGADPDLATPAELAARIRSESARIARIVADAHISPS